jgi:hypothetical protein
MDLAWKSVRVFIALVLLSLVWSVSQPEGGGVRLPLQRAHCGRS